MRKYTISLLSIVILLLIPVIGIFLYISLFGVNVPFWDQWEFIPCLEKYFKHDLDFSYLFSLHNEHRIFFPRIIMLFLGNLTKYNNIAEMYVVYILLIISLVILLYVIRLQFNNDFNNKTLIIALPVCYLMLSLRQYENILWGFQIGFLMVLAFSLLTFLLIYLLTKKEGICRNIYFIMAIVTATVSSFSSAMGLFVWPTVYLQLKLSAIKNKTIYRIWTIIGIVEWCFYFYGFKTPSHHPSIFTFIHNPILFIKYFLVYVGGSLFWDKFTCFSAGLLIIFLILICLISIYKNQRFNNNSFWVSILVFSFLTAISITIGRSGFGVAEALSSRYTTFSILMIVALYVCLIDLFLYKNKHNYITLILGVVIGLIALSIPNSYIEGFETGRDIKVYRERIAFYLSKYDQQPDEFLQCLYPDAQVVKNRAKILKQLKYNVFNNLNTDNPIITDLSVLHKQTVFSIDTINDILVNSQNNLILLNATDNFIIIRGWAVDQSVRDTAGGVYIDIDGKTYPAFYGTDRKDVADYFKISKYRYSGFERAIPLSKIGKGIHSLSIKILTKDKKSYYSPEQKVIFEVQ